MITTILLFPLYAFLFMYLVWAVYVMVMNMIRVKDNMPFASKCLAYPLAIVGVVLDMLLNIVVGTILFLDLPKIQHLLLTARLQEYIDDYNKLTEPATGLRRWRHKAALWICKDLLDPFDPRGFHCCDPKEIRKE